MLAVPELPPKPQVTGGLCEGGSGGGGGGFLGPCCGGGDSDSDEERGYDSEGEHEEYNCLGGGILAGCLPEVREGGGLGHSVCFGLFWLFVSLIYLFVLGVCFLFFVSVCFACLFYLFPFILFIFYSFVWGREGRVVQG